jgi:hypothetical protein
MLTLRLLDLLLLAAHDNHGPRSDHLLLRFVQLGTFIVHEHNDGELTGNSDPKGSATVSAVPKFEEKSRETLMIKIWIREEEKILHPE